MSTTYNPDRSWRVTRIAFFLSMAALVIPICYSLYIIAAPTYYRGPLFTEIRLTILFLGFLGALLGILDWCRRTPSKAFAILAIILGLITPIQHVIFCGSDALYQKYILFCPMLWGIRIS
jgi:hypothetical protein